MMSNREESSEQAIMLGLLDAVERGDVTQRRLSRELGIAVGLVNMYIKRAINRGLIKVQQIPPRRYAYYLTPNGFLEKSQLIASYFIYSFDFFRRARASCEETLSRMIAAGHKRVALIGASELTEVAIIVAADLDVSVAAVVDANAPKVRFAGILVRKDIAAVTKDVDAVMITSISHPQAAFDAAVAALGEERVHLPSILSDIIARAPASAKKKAAK